MNIAKGLKYTCSYMPIVGNLILGMLLGDDIPVPSLQVSTVSGSQIRDRMRKSLTAVALQ
jgi:hypothetical protein